MEHRRNMRLKEKGRCVVITIFLITSLVLTTVSLSWNYEYSQVHQLQYEELEVMPFRFETFRSFIEGMNDPIDIHFETTIDTPELAIYYAERAWTVDSQSILRRPFQVFFDEKEGIWHVVDNTAIPPPMLGGNYHTFITTYGRVIAMFGTA